MSDETRKNFDEFRALVLSDLSLQSRLSDLDDRKEQAARILAMGGEMGFTFSAEDIDAAVAETIQVWIERWM
jgi:hypothetical protein